MWSYGTLGEVAGYPKIGLPPSPSGATNQPIPNIQGPLNSEDVVPFLMRVVSFESRERQFPNGATRIKNGTISAELGAP